MKVKDLVRQLGYYNQELPVCTDDWNMMSDYPNEAAAEVVVMVGNGAYKTRIGNLVIGDFICIGRRDDG